MSGIRHDDDDCSVLSSSDLREMRDFCSAQGRLRIDEQVEHNLLELLFVAAHLGSRVVQLHVDLDSARARCERTKAYCVLDNRVDIDGDIARVRLPGEQKKIADHSDGAIRLALDQAHGFELFSFQLVLEQQLCECRDSGERIIELMRDTRDELTDGSELLGAAEVVRNLALFGEIPNADDESDDLIAPIPDMAQGDGSGKLSPILPAVSVLSSPERLVLRDRRDGRGDLRGGG